MTIIIIAALVILYRALKEPLDMLFGFIVKNLGELKDKVMDRDGGNYIQEIRYG